MDFCEPRAFERCCVELGISSADVDRVHLRLRVQPAARNAGTPPRHGRAGRDCPGNRSRTRRHARPRSPHGGAMDAVCALSSREPLAAGAAAATARIRSRSHDSCDHATECLHCRRFGRHDKAEVSALDLALLVSGHPAKRRDDLFPRDHLSGAGRSRSGCR